MSAFSVRHPDGLRLAFGWAAPKLRVQLRGLGCKPNDVRRWQKCADATVTLGVSSLLTDRERQRIRLRLTKEVATAVKHADPVGRKP
jgi:hypothetical protein